MVTRLAIIFQISQKGIFKSNMEQHIILLNILCFFCFLFACVCLCCYIKKKKQTNKQTHKYKIVDADGNVACITTTIENVFGSKVTVPNRGFTLNNELTDFNSVGITEKNGKVQANSPQGNTKHPT